MKKLLIPVVTLLLIIQNNYLLSADYYETARKAARDSRWQDLYDLIDEGKIDVNYNPDRRNKAPFINTAIVYNDLKAAQELLNRGMELNTGTCRLPLQLASQRYLAKGDNMPMIKLLLEARANPNAEDYWGGTTLKLLDKFNYLPERKQELISLFNQQPPASKYIKSAKK